MAGDWSAVVNTTAPRYLKGAADHTLRERVVFALMNKRKRISHNWSGTDVKHQIKFALPETEAYSGGVLDFEPSDKYRQLSLDWRAYKVTDQMTEMERLKNQGAEALINRYAAKMTDMRQSLEDQFGLEIYVDGYTYTDRMNGIASFTGDDSTYNAADKIANPSDTYGGKSTALGGEAGSWSTDLTTSPNNAAATDWPSGSGSSEYDYLAPRLMRFNTTSWGTGSTSWVDNCERVIRQAIIWTRLTTGRNGRPDIGMFAEDLYYDYLNKQEAKQRITVPYKEIQDLGFPDGCRQEGVSIMFEYGITASTGFLLNIDKMELRCMTPELFASRGPEYDIRTDSYLFAMGFFGNMVFDPKFFSKFASYS